MFDINTHFKFKISGVTSNTSSIPSNFDSLSSKPSEISSIKMAENYEDTDNVIVWHVQDE